MNLQDALAKLSPRDHTLIRLRTEGKTWKVIAAEVGISIGYAQQLHKKAIEELSRLSPGWNVALTEHAIVPTQPDPIPAPAEAPPEPRTMVVTGVPQRVAIVRGVPREEPIEMPQPLTAPRKKVELK